MVTLEKINASLFDNLYESFLFDDDPLSSREDWRNIFDYRWQTDHDHCGYALLDDGKVVGMLGMVFSERQIADTRHKFCNLHTWWVREDHRGRSLALLRPILKLQDYTLTHFTPCDIVRAVTRRLGFTDLSSQLRILLPVGRRQTNQCDLLFEADDVASQLNADERRIFDDHQPYRLGHLVIESGGARCYVLYSHVVRHRLPYCHIHYIGNLDLFARHELAVRRELLQRHAARFVAIDERLIPSLRLRRSFRFWAPANAMFKSPTLRPDQIDNLYSDVVFLRLTTLPDISHELRQRVGKVLPQRSSTPNQ